MNFEPMPLTPTAYLRRAAVSFPDRVAVIDHRSESTYREMHERVARFVTVLRDMGIRPGTRVAIIAPNTRMMLEAHYAVPAAAAVLVPINTRLDEASAHSIIAHSGAALVLVDDTLLSLARNLPVPFLAASQVEAAIQVSQAGEWVTVDETAMLSINYTSGTTGRPKGAVYQHRGAYLQALAMVSHLDLEPASVHLWTLPMFHCHGWTFPWAVTAAGGTHICLPRIDDSEIWRLINEHRVTHFNASPTVLISLARSVSAARPAHGPLRVGTGGAPPSPILLGELENLGINVTHLYGLTETYGPAVVNDWQREWDMYMPDDRARIKSRQGIANILSGEVRVVDGDGRDVPDDGATIGEVVVFGNNVMAGYYKDPAATAAAMFEGGFRTGDLAAKHPDGYIEIRDRLKDIIISGGENISSIEVEHALSRHPDVDEVAVVGVADMKWGEVPVAFVSLRVGGTVSADELVEFGLSSLPRFKAPRRIILGPLPRTSTGKIQKFLLRNKTIPPQVQDENGEVEPTD